MTRFQEAISLGLILGVIHGLVQPAKSVPVVPNFTQGSMTSHTETTSKQTETINSIDYATGWQYTVSGTNVSNNGAALLPPTTTNNVTVTPLGGIEGQVTSSAVGLTSATQTSQSQTLEQRFSSQPHIRVQELQIKL